MPYILDEDYRLSGLNEIAVHLRTERRRRRALLYRFMHEHARFYQRLRDMATGRIIV